MTTVLTPLPSKLISSVEMVRMSGASYKQVDWWTRHHALLPSVPASGSGSRRLYHPHEAVVAAVLASLSNGGRPVDPKVAAAVRRALVGGKPRVVQRSRDGIVRVVIDVEAAAERVWARNERVA